MPSLRVPKITVQPEPTALMGPRIFVGAVLLMTCYAAMRDREVLWLATAALLALDWGACLVLTFSQRIEIEGGELSLKSAIGRRSVRLENIDHVQIGHAASAVPLSLRLVLKSGAPVTWAVRVFGRNIQPVMAALASNSRLVVQPSAL